MKNADRLLQRQKDKIVDGRGQVVTLRGLNLGGWLMMEGYLLGGRNIPEIEFKRRFAEIFGKKELEIFCRLFRENFVREEDIKNIANLGFNCIRVPFNYRPLEDDAHPYRYKKEGIYYLDKIARLCNKYQIYYILDMHAVAGCQNADWHSDSRGRASLWDGPAYQKRCLRLWEFVASRYKDEPFLAGYDIMNEPVNKDSSSILTLYQRIIQAIRLADRRHIIFLEGNIWAQELDFLRNRIQDDNFVYSIHFYAPLDFTFGFCRNLVYPGRMGGVYWSKTTLSNILSKYSKIKKEDKVPIYVGEFGQNSRCPHCHQEFQWLCDTLALFEKFGFHWAYWTYKAVASTVFPDGLYQYQENPAWINRQGPVFGWENYYNLWKKSKKDISGSWQTGNFLQNKYLLDLLTAHLK
jgi:aryl-phospho-beta-D-glucosidase BglC (GH1 family)